MKRIASILIMILFVCFCASASTDLTLRTVVIDAGHGGKDPGAISKDGKTFEKDFTLDIAKRLSTLIKDKYPGVKVVMTRTDDTFISLDRRAEKANECRADLFISIHINSAYSTKSAGFSTHVLGQSSQKNRDLYKANLELVKRENSVVMLDDNYNAKQAGFDPSDPSSYIFMTMMQSAHLQQSIDFAQIVGQKLQGGPITVNRGVSQDPFYVLWKTTMPAVLVELGFISNPQDLKELKKSSTRADLAKRLFEAFKEYKKQYDASTSTSSDAIPVAPTSSGAKSSSQVSPKPSTPRAADKPRGVLTENKVMYGVQIFAVSSDIKKGDSRLLGYEPMVFQSGRIKKYVVGISDSREKTLKEYKKVKAKYPDCFMVEIKGETISRCK